MRRSPQHCPVPTEGHFARHGVKVKRLGGYRGPIISLGKSTLVTTFTHTVGKTKIIAIINWRFIISEHTNVWSEILAPVK